MSQSKQREREGSREEGKEGEKEKRKAGINTISDNIKLLLKYKLSRSGGD